ncbi:MAG: hypothetical protein HUU25_04290 [Candidatus Sumerlaeia bacterium]|nr:hypothetical protein [Candidatus Sumerlaeia bacterium]
MPQDNSNAPTGLALLDDAMAKYRLELGENLESAQQRHGFTLFHSLSPEEKVAHLKRLGFAPQDGIDHYNLGCVAALQENFEEAAAEFGKAVKENEFFEAVHNHALALERAGKSAEAKTKWKRALDLAHSDDERERIREHLASLG